MNTPLYTHLINYHKQNRISFAMPGHKNGAGLAKDIVCCDVTELRYTEDLYEPGIYIQQSQHLIAQKYGSNKSYILTGGATSGIQSMIAASLKKGEILLSTPDCHMSVINTCALLGIRLMFMPMRCDENGHYKYFDYTTICRVIENNHDIKAVLAVSPDYYGVTKNLSELSSICKQYKIPLLADQAHGAHFVAGEAFPATAVEEGADCTVMSAHKTLNALTGAAYLHFNSDIINKGRLTRALSMFQTSSPSYPIAASAEKAILELDNNAWEKCVKQCETLKSKILNDTNISVLNNDDPTRMVFFNLGIKGTEAERILANDFGIDIEMSDAESLIFIATPWNSDSDYERAYTALKEICRCGNRLEKIAHNSYIYKDIISPSEGFWSDYEMIDLKYAHDRVSACTVTAYPPGVPVICCGAVIDKTMISRINELIDLGIKIRGMDNMRIAVVKTE